MFDVQQDKCTDVRSQPAKEKGGAGAREHSTRTVLLHAALISFTDCSPTVDVALLLVLPHAAIKVTSHLVFFSLVFVMVSKERN